MKADTTQTAKKPTAAMRNGTELDRRYGQVAIAAVAAAMRYGNGRDVSGSAQLARPAARRETAHV